MGISKENLNLVLGLKVGWLRQQRNLSLKELSEKSGLSISYINEIEKGKKYPKAEKIMALADALDKPYDELVSLQLDQQLTPLSELLSTSIMQEIPFELFGFNKSDLMDFMTNAPARFAALIDTIIKMAKSYDMSVENVLFGALRSYQEMHNNYFPDIEEKVDEFKKKLGLEGRQITYAELKYHLEKEYEYHIDETTLSEDENLKHFRSLYLPKKPPVMYVNNQLQESQRLFSLGRELGYEVLGLKARVSSSSNLKDTNFDQLLNNTRASYFSGALLIDRNELVADIKEWFAAEKWEDDLLHRLLKKYKVTPEMLFHRLTQIMAEFFQIDQFYFLRFNHHTKTNEFTLTKELHFSKLHSAHGIGLNEHYCRRWVTIDLLTELHNSQQENPDVKNIIGVQRSQFYQTENEYFCISEARPLNLQSNVNSCVTIGFLMNQKFKRKARFWDDDQIERRIVNRTCERCGIADCKERVAEPVVYQRQIKENRISESIDRLASGNS